MNSEQFTELLNYHASEGCWLVAVYGGNVDDYELDAIDHAAIEFVNTRSKWMVLSWWDVDSRDEENKPGYFDYLKGFHETLGDRFVLITKELDTFEQCTFSSIEDGVATIYILPEGVTVPRVGGEHLMQFTEIEG